MNDEIEKRLLRLKDSLEWSEDLESEADLAVHAGIREAKAKQQGLRCNHKRRSVWSAAAVSLLFIAFLLSIRVSPVIASTISHIPGMAGFVKIIQEGLGQDPALQDALNSELVQRIDVSDSHDGLTFTVEGIIADESRMVLMYAVRGGEDGEKFEISDLQLTDGNASPLQAGIIFNTLYASQTEHQEKGVYRDVMDVLLSEGTPIPNKVGLRVILRGIAYDVHFSIDHTKFAGMKEEYVLNQTIEVEGQKITFAKATIYPLRISLEMAYDPNNTKQIFGPGDIHLIDDQGQEWRTTSGYAASGDPDRSILYFQSNYFRKPTSLSLVGSWFRALDKDQLEVIVDTRNSRILKAPDSRLSIAEIKKDGSGLKLKAKLIVPKDDDTLGYSLFQPNVKDTGGKTFTITNSSTSLRMLENGGSEQYIELTIPDAEAYEQPLTFQIYNYPQYISKPYRIPIR